MYDISLYVYNDEISRTLTKHSIHKKNYCIVLNHVFMVIQINLNCQLSIKYSYI